MIEDMLEKLPEEYNMAELIAKTAQRNPYILICFQECERMNLLLSEIRNSLNELDLGLKVLWHLLLRHLSMLYSVINKDFFDFRESSPCLPVWRFCSRPSTVILSQIPGPNFLIPLLKHSHSGDYSFHNNVFSCILSL